jgi:hypothetical protein
MRIIEVKSCKECPYCRDDNGGGFCSEFTICDKFGIMLIDDGYWHDMDKIHKKCKLKKV